jgi:nitrogen regulatory protein P-II 1
MNYLVIAVVDEIEQCAPLMEAWESAGVTGITILESTGLGRIRKGANLRDDLPLIPSLRNLLQTREEHHRTLFTVVRDESMIDRIFEATESVLGDLREPNKGIIIALPVARTLGLPKRHQAADNPQ